MDTFKINVMAFEYSTPLNYTPALHMGYAR
jgi:hypothetical protein